jgi:hypothetical protein
MRESIREMIFRPGNANRRSCGELFLMICLALLVFLPVIAAAVDCDDVNVSPVADFKYDINPAESAPIMVNFYSTSTGGRVGMGGKWDPVESYSWMFGDGDASEETNPMHTYAMSSARYQAEHKPFPVTLIITTGCGRVATTTKNVSVYCISQKAGFTVVQPVGDGPFTTPVALYLQDTSLHVADGVTTYHYTLWDSGMTRLFKESTEKDPVFVITNGGRYVIRQEVFKGCSNPPAPDTEMTKNFEVTGSASSDAIPMDTIPFTTSVTEYSAPDAQVATSASRTTAPEPSAAETSPGNGTLSVDTTPAGAQVYVDDVLRGISPASIPELTTGSHTLRIEKSGYRKKTIAFTIWDGELTVYSGTLEAESGGIVPILAAVIIIAAGVGAGYWYMKRKKPVKPAVDWNNP